MRVVVTGGKGFIGTNLLDKLKVNSEYSATSYDIYEGDQDICDFMSLKTEVSGSDAVVHLAAETGVVASSDNPSKVINTNVVGTQMVLQAAVECGVRKVVFASSGAVFSKRSSVYGASKIAGEALCRAYNDSFGLSVTILRFGNVYGPHSASKTSVVHKFIKQLLDNQALTVRGNGLQERSFVYVSDVVDAIIDYMNHKEFFEVAHITSREMHPVIDIASTLSRIAQSTIGTSPSIKFVDPVDEPDSVHFESTCEPKVSLMEGLYRTLEWYIGVGNGQQRH